MRRQRWFSVSDVEAEDILDTRDLQDCLSGLDEESEDEDESALAQDEADSIWGLNHMGPLSSYIDWTRWANDLLHDYTSIEIGETTFYYR